MAKTEDKKSKRTSKDLNTGVETLTVHYDNYKARQLFLKTENSKWKKLHEDEIKSKKNLVEYLQWELQSETEKRYNLLQELDAVKEDFKPRKQLLEQETAKMEEKLKSTKESLMKEKQKVISKLGLLGDVSLQKDKCALQLHQVEEKLKKDTEYYRNQLQEFEKDNMLQRIDLENEYKTKTRDLFQKFSQVSLKQLSASLKGSLKKCINIANKIEKTSIYGTQIQEEHDQLEADEKYMRIEFEIDNIIEKSIHGKIKEQNNLIKSLQEECEKQKNMLSSLQSESTQIEKTNELEDLETELQILRSSWLTMESKQKEQEKYLNETKNLTEKLQIRNFELQSAIRNTEEIIEKEKDSAPDDLGVRIELLKQLQFLIRIADSVRYEKNDLLKGVDEKFTPNMVPSL